MTYIKHTHHHQWLASHWTRGTPPPVPSNGLAECDLSGHGWWFATSNYRARWSHAEKRNDPSCLGCYPTYFQTNPWGFFSLNIVNNNRLFMARVSRIGGDHETRVNDHEILDVMMSVIQLGSHWGCWNDYIWFLQKWLGDLRDFIRNRLGSESSKPDDKISRVWGFQHGTWDLCGFTTSPKSGISWK